jgi:hypothetical protein
MLRVAADKKTESKEKMNFMSKKKRYMVAIARKEK